MSSIVEAEQLLLEQMRRLAKVSDPAELKEEIKRAQVLSNIGKTLVAAVAVQKGLQITPNRPPTKSDPIAPAKPAQEVLPPRSPSRSPEEEDDEETITLDDIPSGQKHEAKQRKCLRCQEMFESQWSGDRICKHCKGLTGAETRDFGFDIDG